MKKSYVIILFVLIPFLLLAGKTNAGIKFGMNFATLKGFGTEYGDNLAESLNAEDDYSSFKSSNATRKPLTAGLFVAHELTKKISLQGELGISNKGISIKTDGLYDDQKLTLTTIYKVNYLDIPLLVKLNISKEKNNRLNIYFGPSLSMLSSSKIYLKAKMGEEEDDDEIDVTGYNETDYGLNFGFEAIMSSNMIFDCRYTLGMTNILDGELEATDDRNGDTVDYKNSVFNISIGFGF
jgi:hypothetical protein